MRKKILIVAGGYSNERDISLQTAASVYLELKKNRRVEEKKRTSSTYQNQDRRQYI